MKHVPRARPRTYDAGRQVQPLSLYSITAHFGVEIQYAMFVHYLINYSVLSETLPTRVA